MSCFTLLFLFIYVDVHSVNNQIVIFNGAQESHHQVVLYGQKN